MVAEPAKQKSKKLTHSFLIEQLLSGVPATELKKQGYGWEAIARANKKVAHLKKIQEEALNLAKE